MITIKLPNKIHNNYKIEFYEHGNALDADKFEKWMLINVFNSNLKDILHPFFQGGYNNINSDWKYVEFWCEQDSKENHELILEIAEKLCYELNCELDIR